jgi:hypothetical protein
LSSLSILARDRHRYLVTYAYNPVSVQRGATMMLFEHAQQELRRLESRWMSLLSWLSENAGVSAGASARWAGDSKKAAGARRGGLN